MDTGDIPSQLEMHKFHISRTDGFWRAAFESANAAGRNAVNSILLGSGGAVVALLAFLGNLLSKDTSRDYLAQTHITNIVHGVARALVPFVGSMFLAMITAALTYIGMYVYSRASASDDHYRRHRLNEIGGRFNTSAIVTGSLSLLTFAYGAYVGIAMLGNI